MAKREILFDAINVGGSKDRRLSQRPPSFGAFALKQMAFARASEKHFSSGG
jgi:hypothetical protein